MPNESAYKSDIGSLIMLHWDAKKTGISAMNLLLTAGDVYTRRVANDENPSAVYADVFVPTRENTKIAKALGLVLRIDKGEYVPVTKSASGAIQREKNEMGKSRKVNNPYMVYRAGDWEWRVLKAYQAPGAEKRNKYARWFCAVKSPMTHGSYDMGDTYVTDVKRHAVKVDDITNLDKW